MTSIIKVDNLQNQCGANIINENAGTITIGASGDTVTLAAGASQSGFGRSGSVNWDTTPKTTGFTAVNGEGYFANTSGGAFTMTLPAGSAGAIVSVADYTNSFQTNALTITPNGSEKINGGVGAIILSTEGQSLTLLYVDSIEGWKSVQDSTTSPVGSNFITATGGTITCDGDFKVHTFTGPGTFTVTSAGNPSGSTTVDYLVVAGGAGGGGNQGGGGGAGGFRQSFPNPATGGFPVTAQGYPITVGGGGAGNPGPGAVAGGAGTSGTNSIFSTITSTGGGGGGGRPANNAASGGSGGGGGGCGSRTGGAGNTPPVAPPQGNTGGDGQQPDGGGGGGGGAGAVGSNSVAPRTGGAGGAGSGISITGSSVTYAGGGGGGSGIGAGGLGGSGIGGNGGSGPPAVAVGTGTTNTGSGGGGGGNDTPNVAGAAGGSGIVIIRYKYQ
jgi:hypothetical protein